MVQCCRWVAAVCRAAGRPAVHLPGFLNRSNLLRHCSQLLHWCSVWPLRCALQSIRTRDLFYYFCFITKSAPPAACVPAAAGRGVHPPGAPTRHRTAAQHRAVLQPGLPPLPCGVLTQVSWARCQAGAGTRLTACEGRGLLNSRALPVPAASSHSPSTLH